MNIDTMRVTECAAHWAGMDVAKASFDVGLVRWDQRYPATPLREIPVRQFARTREGVEAFVVWLDDVWGPAPHTEPVRACMEATGSYSAELAVWLLEQRPALQPAIVNPQRTSAFIKSLGLRNKTDKLEARALGFYGVERRPVAYEPPTAEQATLRDLSRYRDALVRARVAEKERAAEPASSKVVRQLQRKRIRQLERDIERVEEEMRRLVRERPELARDVAQLTTIYGVGFVTAVVVLVELGDLRRFQRARQLSAYAGVSPRLVESGSSVHGRPRMCKQGNARARQALYLASVTVIRGHSDLQQDYCRLLAQGKAPKVALGAVMRKLLTIMRAILISGEPYRPHYKTCGKLHRNTCLKT